MAYYPAMLRLKNKHVVVIGGGTIATRKIESLLTAEAAVTVISPELTWELMECAATGLISWRKKYFEDEDIIGAFIIIAATNERAVNEQVYRAAHFSQLINVVDQAELSNFTVPASNQN